MIEIKEATNLSDFETIEKLAREILPAVYDPIITSKNTQYFLDTFQTAKAIQEQINHENYHYYLLNFDSIVTGYLGLQLLDNTLLLSKFYILPAYRGKKIGKAALDFVNEFAQKYTCNTIALFVHSDNEKSISIYKGAGYEITGTEIRSFESGDQVTDFKMEKKIGVAPKHS